MRIPMTFQELLNEYDEDDVFPLEIDDALRETIKKWFEYRRLCVTNPEKFIVFFQRTLQANYLRYRELLRIEPGIAKFDWLVETYREMQNTRLATISDEELAVLNGTITGQTSGTKNITVDNDETIADTITNTRTNNLSEVVDETIEHGGIDERTKEDTRTDDLTSNRTVDDENTRTDNLQSKTDSTRSSLEQSGGYHSEVSKSAPNSASYGENPVISDTFVSGGNAMQAIRLLDYQYMDAQALSNDLNDNKLTGTDDTTVKDTGTQKNERDLAEIVKDTGTQRHDISDEMSYGHTVDTDKTKLNTGTVSDNGSKNRVVDGTKVTSETDGGTKSETSTGRNTKTNEKAIDDLNRERSTGRNTEIAKLLSRAAGYIAVTSAWLKFLKPELEPCFYGTYVEEDYEDE